ncbi:YncE family protein [Antrihabitans cavernicola]|uniref:YncE family protein n=1 Tax=Antrihabitans cavernicola TaxID=2495913 RepID=A0A5A7S9X7_9NOCA|nr:YncE family protein [Spelaeibacter cavernicola]KAA0021345.1 YncE family protein [Spelaeibacter cavernicola]
MLSRRFKSAGLVVTMAVATALTVATVGVGVAQAAPPGGQPGELYIPEVDNDTVAVMDTVTHQITHRIPMRQPVGFSHPAVLAVTPDHSKIYSDNFSVAGLPTVGVIDTKTKTAKTIPIFTVALGIFLSPNGKQILVPELGFTIEVIDIATDKIVKTWHYGDVPAGAFPGPDGLVYVGFVSGLIAAIDPNDGHIVKRPIWSGGVATFWYSFANGGHKLYTDTINSIGVIDVDKWELVKTIPTTKDGIGKLTNPGAFVSEVTPDGKKLYVTTFGGAEGTMVIDTATDQWVDTIPMEGAQIGLTFSPDGKRAYISDSASFTNLPTPVGELTIFNLMVSLGQFVYGPGRLVVVDTATNKIIDVVPTEKIPGIPAFIPK